MVKRIFSAGRGILAVRKRELRMDPMDRTMACNCWLKASSTFLGHALQTFEERSLIARDRPSLQGPLFFFRWPVHFPASQRLLWPFLSKEGIAWIAVNSVRCGLDPSHGGFQRVARFGKAATCRARCMGHHTRSPDLHEILVQDTP
ncbi:unnamed protein product [Effrenium voratum]|nr:unnamed protein product [Effrenium voratum]